MSNQSKNPSLALWNKRAAKRFVDEQIFRCMASWKLPKKNLCNVLSLPAGSWFWERDFTAAFPNAKINFVGVERNSTVLKTMRRNADSLNKLNRRHKFIPVDHPVDLADFLKDTDEVFDMIYLDWMGTWATDKFNQIKTILDREILRKGGLLRLTMALNRGKPSVWKTLCSEYDPTLIGVQDMRAGGNDFSDLPQWKVYGVPGLIIREAAERGVKLKLVSNIAYVSRETPTARGTSELSVVLRRY